jgi:hypothetical protein
VFINDLLKDTVAAMVKKLKYPSESRESSVMLVVMFTVTFINTAFIALLDSMSFAEIDGGNGVFSYMFASSQDGETDFGVRWYQIAGCGFMINMILSAVTPPIDFVWDVMCARCDKCKDRNYTSNSNATKQPSVQAYIKLYSGPKFLIYKYCSDVLLFVSMAFLYGTAMPLIYSITLACLLVLWVQERILLCRYYSIPPAYSDQVTRTMVPMLRYMPLFALPFVFWQLGNRQIFDNVLFTIQSAQDVRLSGHIPSQALSELANEALPYNSAPFILFIVGLILFIVI